MDFSRNLFWQALLVFAAADLVFLILLIRKVKPERFQLLKWTIPPVAYIFWFILWGLMVWGFYKHFSFMNSFPENLRWAVPVLYGLLYGFIGFALWWLSRHFPGNPVMNFCLLGGILSAPGHSCALYWMMMIKKVPVVQGVNEISAYIFGVFEFIFYWCLILAISLAVEKWKKKTP